MDTAQKLFLKDKIRDVDLLSLEDKQIDIAKLSIISLKEPKTGLILGIFFGVFGVDRFYKGDIFLGIIKLILFFISHIALIVASFSHFVFLAQDMPELSIDPSILEESVTIVFLTSISIWVLFMIWVFIDWFLVYRGIKKDNFQKILMVI